METNVKNLNKIETFIFVHDQEIILDFINKNRFSEFENFKYVFLGSRNIDKLKNIGNVIIARDLDNNIENYPKLTSFTGWYLLVKNDLIKSEYVNLFEYDVNCVNGFNIINRDIINQGFDFIGYFPMSVHDPVYLEHSRYSDVLCDSIFKKTNIKVKDIINNLLDDNYFLQWSSSSNSTWKVSELNKFVIWFEQFIDDIKNNIYCGHMHERSLSFYYFIHNLNVGNFDGLMTHYQLNTHGTSPLPPERFNELYKKLI